MRRVNEPVFNELKQGAIAIWDGYVKTNNSVNAREKIAYIESIRNYDDNWGTFVGMLDINNQRKLYDSVGPEAQSLINRWVGGLKEREAEARLIGLLH